MAMKRGGSPVKKRGGGMLKMRGGGSPMGAKKKMAGGGMMAKKKMAKGGVTKKRGGGMLKMAKGGGELRNKIKDLIAGGGFGRKPSKPKRPNPHQDPKKPKRRPIPKGIQNLLKGRKKPKTPLMKRAGKRG